ncbi:MAG: DUF4349 domain-containing protein [Caldisericota bacterium]|nr:DUF4349 domain-containing protein [Caldisericota bacterium]
MNNFVNFLKKNKTVLALLIIVVIIGIGGVSYLFLETKISKIGKTILPQNQTNEFLSSYPQDTTFEDETTRESGTYFGKSDTNAQFGLKIIKNGSTSLQVEKGKFFDVWNKIIFTAKGLDGFVSNSNYYKQDEYYYGIVSIMIPSKDFDTFAEQISKLGKTENMRVSTKDVTGEYVDLSSRIKVLESQKNLLLSWLSKSNDVKDMIALRNELEKVESEIEQIKGRMNYITFHTDFSEITISITEEGKIPVEKPEILLRLVAAWKIALNALVSSLAGFIIFVGWVIPWVVILYIIYLIYKKRKGGTA